MPDDSKPDSSKEFRDMARRPLKTRSAAWPKVVAKALIRIGLLPNHVSVLSMIFSTLAAVGLLSRRGRIRPAQPCSCSVPPR